MMQDSLTQQYRVSAEDARCELSVALIKLQSLESQLREANNSLMLKKMELQQTKLDADVFRENNARQASLIKSLRESLSIADSKILQFGAEISQKISRINSMETESKMSNSEFEKVRKNSQESMNALSETNRKLKEMFDKIVELLGENLSRWEDNFPDNINDLLSLLESELRNNRDSISHFKNFEKENQKLNKRLTLKNQELQKNQESYRDLEEKYVWACEKLENLNKNVLDQYRDVFEKSGENQADLNSYFDQKLKSNRSGTTTSRTDNENIGKSQSPNQDKNNQENQEPVQSFKASKDNLENQNKNVQSSDEKRKTGEFRELLDKTNQSKINPSPSAKPFADNDTASVSKPFSSAQTPEAKKEESNVGAKSPGGSKSGFQPSGLGFPSLQIRKSDDPPYQPTPLPKKNFDNPEGKQFKIRSEIYNFSTNHCCAKFCA